ncbi:AAA family ATPase [Glutamicibacter sp. JC586]|uniref:AAA family ATPase n=1 Tax=Glutamicibacter sp. JC586 TaxID=2590552 RepID=UPI00190F8295|nr:AAA family ATPase [Glutamicibacter sp. JC586]
MLRKINLQDPWRSLDKNFWPDDLPAGRRTVVYGHNGSGKSTLSELLLSLSEDSSLTNVIWEDEHKTNTKIGFGESAGPQAVAVFTRKWVEKNLADFLDGDSASAIVTLGKDAIDAKEEEKTLKSEFSQLRDEAEKAEKQGKETNQKIDKLAREVQDRTISELQEFDRAHFTRNRYSLPKIKDRLRAHEGSFPDSNKHAEALKHLAEGVPAQVPLIAEPPVGSIPNLSELSQLLKETPTRIALETLETNSKAQSWVEQGLELHIGIDHCLFCAEQLTEVRRAQLAQHFDESWLRIRSKAKSLLEAVTRAKDALTTWYAGIPTESALASHLKSTFETAKKIRTGSA